MGSQMSLTGKPALTTASAVDNDGFWPDLTIGDLMRKYRIPPEYDDSTIKTGLVNAMLGVNSKLQAVKWAVKVLAYADFLTFAEAIQPDTLNDVNILQLHYEHAVFARAKADLLKQFNSLNRKPNAENAVKESDDTGQYWLDESQASIKAIFKAALPLDESVSGTANAYVASL